MNDLVGRVLVYVLVAAVAWVSGWKVCSWKQDSEQAQELKAREAQEAIVRQAVAVIADTTAKAVAGIRITNTTIYQKTRHEITKEPMDPGCRLPAGWMRNINAARAGADRPEPAAAVP